MTEADSNSSDFERLLQETYRMVYQIAYSALTNAADAEEVAQDVFLRAHHKLSSLHDRQKFRAWVARMSWRLALNRLRLQSRSVRRDGAWLALQAPPADPESEAAQREFASRLTREIANLPEKLRSVLVLSGVEGMNAGAIGATLGIPEGTVRSRLFLARRRLLEILPMTPCRQWNDELLECALGRPLTRALSAHLARCVECKGTLEAWRAKAREMDRVLTRLAASEPRYGGPERVLARIATTAAAPAYPRLAAAAAALIILAGVIALTARPESTIRLSTWRSPTQCLLRSPADPLLKSVPRLGDGLFEVYAGKENHAQ